MSTIHFFVTAFKINTIIKTTTIKINTTAILKNAPMLCSWLVTMISVSYPVTIFNRIQFFNVMLYKSVTQSMANWLFLDRTSEFLSQSGCTTDALS